MKYGKWSDFVVVVCGNRCDWLLLGFLWFGGYLILICDIEF